MAMVMMPMIELSMMKGGFAAMGDNPEGDDTGCFFLLVRPEND